MPNRPRVVLCQITMNAGDGIAGSTIKYTLENFAYHFDKVVVVDGDLTKEAREYYEEFENLVAVDSPWKDSYVDQYRAWASQVDDGDWVLYLDCDEMPSQELMGFIKGPSALESLGGQYNTICLPCVLFLKPSGGDRKYYPSEPWPEDEWSGQWVKNILVKKDQTLDFKHFGSHVIPHHGAFEKATYFANPYYHMKTLESFVYNDVWQAFLHPEAQHYTPVEANMFKMLTRQYKTTQEFKKATKEGTWSPALQKFAWDKKFEFDRPISRLSWVYWILEGHLSVMSDWAPSWDLVKDHVLDKEKIGLMNEAIEKGDCIEV